MPRIMEVRSVNLVLSKSHPPILNIAAIGSVNTSGWKNFRIEPHIYVTPPSDGIWDMDFVGDAPTGIVLPVLQGACAGITVRAPQWCNGVRIHAVNNNVEATPNVKSMVEAIELP